MLASTVLTNCFEGMRHILRYTVTFYTKMIDKHVYVVIFCVQSLKINKCMLEYVIHTWLMQTSDNWE